MTRLTAAACIWLACATVAMAQNDDPIVNRGSEPTTPPDAQAVYVRDSGVASERLDLAQRLEKQKEWDKAADVYQDLAQKYADRVVPARMNDAGQPVQYISARQAVQDRLAKWPPEGLAAYRKRFEDTARDLLNADADDVNATRVMTLYFLTDAGRDAAMRVMASSFERGDFVTSAAVGRRLLDGHPGVVAERPKVLLSTGIAAHLAGRDTDARARLDELKSRFADALVTVAGQDTKAADALERAIAAPAPAPGRYRSDDWPSAYGTPDAAAVPETVTAGGAKLFSVELPGIVRRNVPAAAVASFKQASDRERRNGVFTGVLPAVDGGTLFFQDNARVWAISLASGLPLPGWLATYPGEKGGAYVIEADPTPKNRQTAVSVTPDSVVALLAQYDAAAANTIGPSPQRPQLVCLDRTTGRRTWSTTAGQLRLPDVQLNLREGTFYGTPVVDDTTVYALLYANRGGQFEECYLVALNLADGAFKWASYVASTSLGNRANDFDGVTDSNTLTTATLSMAGGRLYVATNLGAVACLDSTDGRTLWLNVYPRSKTPPVGFIAARLTVNKPFLYGPPVVTDGRVFVLPTDSPSILIYDAADGSPLREIRRHLDAKSEITTLVGVVDDSLILCNRTTLYRLPWKAFDPAKPLLENGGRFKILPPSPNDKSQPADAIRGRPFVSGKTILVTTAERLYRLSLDTLQIESQYPIQSQSTWDDEESPGNVLATPDNLIIAGPTRVTAYADLNVATGKLDTRLKADANDVDAYLRYAELLFAAGQPKAAIERIDQAVDHLGGPTKLTPGPMRDRLYEVAASFAAKLQRVDPASAFVPQLYDRAALAAATPQQQVRFRLGQAAACRQASKADEELALYQQILAEPAWRSAPVAGKAGPSTAGSEAEAGIADLLRLHGTDLYAVYDTAARGRFDELKTAADADADALVSIADAYPSAKVVPDVLALAAERFEAVHQPRRASQTLRRLLGRDLSNDRRQSVLQSLARNYLRVPNQAAVAQVRLRQAVAVAPEAKLDQPLLLPDGSRLKVETAAAAVAELDAYRAKLQHDALSTLGAPLTTGLAMDAAIKPAFQPAKAVTAAAAIINQQADIAQSGRVVIMSPQGKVGVVAADSGRVAWTEAAPSETPSGCGFVGDTLVTVAPTEVSGTDAAGKVRWTLRADALPAIDVAPSASPSDASTDEDPQRQPQQIIINNGRPMQLNQRMRVRLGRVPFPQAQPQIQVQAPPPPGERFMQFRLLSDRVVLATSSGRVMALDLVDGHLTWQARMSDVAAGRLLSNDDFVVVSHADPAGASSQVYVFDAQSGQVVQHRTYDANAGQPPGGLSNLKLSPDGVLITLLGSRLVGQDLYDPGSREWKLDRVTGQAMGELPFTQSTADGQLVIAGDRVLVVYRALSGQQSVRVYDLRTLKPVTAKDPNGREPEVSYVPGPGDPDGAPLSIQANGPAFYVVGQRSLKAYDPKSTATWDVSQGAGDHGPTRDVLLARDFLVLISQISRLDTTAQKVPAVSVSLFNRMLTPPSNFESGTLEQRASVTDAAQLIAGEWQIADGAFYYVSGDRQLKVLRVTP